MIRNIIRLLRPIQWIKNAFIFAPLLFAGNLFEIRDVLKSGFAFLCFSLLASSIYAVNDIIDLEEDRKHPIKQSRPLPSGTLPVSAAFGLSLILAVGSFTLAICLGRNFLLVALAYFILNLVYSRFLKHIVILDVFSITAGFLLRVISGGIAINVQISHWLLICTALLALFLGFSKRRHELVLLGDEAMNHRAVLRHYNPHFLDQMLAVITASALMSYVLYTVDSRTIQTFGTNKLLLTTPFVIYGIFRYQYLVYHKNRGGNPTEELLNDIPLLLDIVLWVLTIVAVIYLGGQQ